MERPVEINPELDTDKEAQELRSLMTELSARQNEGRASIDSSPADYEESEMIRRRIQDLTEKRQGKI